MPSNSKVALKAILCSTTALMDLVCTAALLVDVGQENIKALSYSLVLGENSIQKMPNY